MILMQYDHEFESKIVRMVELIDYVYSGGFLSTKTYKVLVEFEDDSAGGNIKVKELMYGHLPHNSKIVKDEEAFSFILNKIFNELKEWPELELKKEK